MKIEDIRNGIAENPELKTALLTELDADIPTHLTGKGYVVRTADEQTAWEKEFETNKINPRVKEIYGNLEKDLLDTFGPIGLKKESNTERVFDMAKRVPGLYDAVTNGLKQQIADLQEGKGDEVTKKQIEALEAQVNQLTTDKTTLETSFTIREIEWQKGSDQEKAFAELQIAVPAHIAEKDKGDFIATKRGQLLTTLNSIYKAETKEVDGKPTLVYTKNGEIQMKGAALATAKDLLMEVGKYDFEAPKKGGSGGDGGDGGNGGASGDYAGVTDKASLYAAAAKKGLVAGSDDFMAFVTAGAKAKNLTIDGIKKD